MNRRRFVAAIGTLAVGVPGCQSLAGTESDDQAPETLTAAPIPTGTPTPTPDRRRTYDRTVSVSAGRNYHAVEVERETRFVLRWSVSNDRGANTDFDVFLFTEREFEAYRRVVAGGDGAPEYIESGTVEGVRESASATVALDPGRYRLVVNNAPLGDAGASGRSVPIRAQVRVVSRPI